MSPEGSPNPSWGVTVPLRETGTLGSPKQGWQPNGATAHDALPCCPSLRGGHIPLPRPAGGLKELPLSRDVAVGPCGL